VKGSLDTNHCITSQSIIITGHYESIMQDKDTHLLSMGTALSVLTENTSQKKNKIKKKSQWDTSYSLKIYNLHY